MDVPKSKSELFELRLKLSCVLIDNIKNVKRTYQQNAKLPHVSAINYVENTLYMQVYKFSGIDLVDIMAGTFKEYTGNVIKEVRLLHCDKPAMLTAVSHVLERINVAHLTIMFGILTDVSW